MLLRLQPPARGTGVFERGALALRSGGWKMVQNSHCSYCGARFADDAPWPRRCASCGSVAYLNPAPVAVLLQPVEGGLLAIRRAIPPVGRLALPGGYVDVGESWQAAAARELREETGIGIDPAGIREVRVLSAPDGTLLVFGLAPPLCADALPPFTPSPETSERVVLGGPSEEMAFPLHAQVVREYFAGWLRPPC
ncbi:NUDIX domain-containing protein [Longimicrobium sp.]|uniref:NUDIX domain-containing protein n=1 Tax=Longimicrobium sp. TaxID=2029185 RepID=UPI002C050756|nr:NUDIX domain-containing protein [Longimicrobium sp.]HSU13059.1 NUDIX domain-containing protein [Longimicrobium sp.]